MSKRVLWIGKVLFVAVKNTVEHVLQNQVPVGAENDNYDALQDKCVDFGL